MANIDLRDPTAADIGVPGAFQQVNTTYSFDIVYADIYANAEETPEVDDEILIMNLPQGFVIQGASVEVVVAPTAGTGEIGLAFGDGAANTTIIAEASTLSDGQILFVADGAGGITVTEPDAVDRTLRVINAGITPPDLGEVLRVKVTGVALHPRG